jgi:hypothetical protein
METQIYTFRIRKARGAWRIETWENEPPYGPAWQPALTGCETIEQAREFFDTAKMLEWDNDSQMTGRYHF